LRHFGAGGSFAREKDANCVKGACLVNLTKQDFGAVARDGGAREFAGMDEAKGQSLLSKQLTH
jgi:hypothetical protein